MLLTVRKNAQITLPASVRKKANIEDGDLLEVEVRGDEVVLKPKKLVDKSQAWFWSKEWQEAEKAAQADIEQGRIQDFSSADDLINDLQENSEQ